MNATTPAYAGSPLCTAVNALLTAIHAEPDIAVAPPIVAAAEALRRAHNTALFDEALERELPDSRRTGGQVGEASHG